MMRIVSQHRSRWTWSLGHLASLSGLSRHLCSTRELFCAVRSRNTWRRPSATSKLTFLPLSKPTYSSCRLLRAAPRRFQLKPWGKPQRRSQAQRPPSNRICSKRWEKIARKKLPALRRTVIKTTITKGKEKRKDKDNKLTGNVAEVVVEGKQISENVNSALQQSTGEPSS